MHLLRHGHACFSLFDDEGVHWLFDPYRPGGLGGRIRLTLPPAAPDRILLTHAHEDHAWRPAAWARVPVWESAREEGAARLRVAAVPHDRHGGSRMGFVRALRLEVRREGGRPFVLVHAGDAGVPGDPALVEICRDADLLLAPAGGRFTFEAEDAVALARAAGVARTVLMHLREPGIDLPMRAPEEAFARAGVRVGRVPSGRLDLPEIDPPAEPSFLWLAPTAPLMAA